MESKMFYIVKSFDSDSDGQYDNSFIEGLFEFEDDAKSYVKKLEKKNKGGDIEYSIIAKALEQVSKKKKKVSEGV